MNSAAIKTTVDVRNVPAPQCHPLIFDTFKLMVPGEAMMLVNDHDPKPLLHQFHDELGDIFTWDYVEQGPEVWQVRIGRIAACCT